LRLRHETNAAAALKTAFPSRALGSFLVVELMAVLSKTNFDGDMDYFATSAAETVSDGAHELILDRADAAVRANGHYNKVLVWPTGEIDAQTSEGIQPSAEKRSSSICAKRHSEHRLDQFR